MKRFVLTAILAALAYSAHAQNLPSPALKDVSVSGTISIPPAQTVSSFTKGILFATTNTTTVTSTLNHIRISQSAGASNEYEVGSGAQVAGLNFQMISVATSDATSNMYGVIGDIENYGPGTVKGLYGRATCQSGGTGVCVGIVAGITSASTTTTAWGLQMSMDTYTNASAVPIEAAFRVGSNVPGNQSKLTYGFLLTGDMAVQAGGAGFQMSAQSTGDLIRLLNSGLSAYLFQVTSTGQTGIGTSAGGLGFGEQLSVTGFMGIGSTVTGVVGDTGSGAFVIGSQTNNDVELRRNGSPIAYLAAGGVNLPTGKTYQINGVSGATCSGAPTGSFATVGGIVTTC